MDVSTIDKYKFLGNVSTNSSHELLDIGHLIALINETASITTKATGTIQKCAALTKDFGCLFLSLSNQVHLLDEFVALHSS